MTPPERVQPADVLRPSRERGTCSACASGPTMEWRDRSTGRTVRGCLGCRRVTVVEDGLERPDVHRLPLVDARAGAVGDCFVCGTCGRVRCVAWRRAGEVRALCADCGLVMRDQARALSVADARRVG